MQMIPPQPPPTWDHSPDDIIALAKEIIDKDRVLRDGIGVLVPDNCTFESVFLPLAGAEAHVESIKEPLTFYKNVSASKELRDAANVAESLFSDYEIESSMRVDVFRAKVAAEKNLKASKRREMLSAEEQRLVEMMILDGTRAGLDLPENTRVELTGLKKELSQICLEFMKHFNEEDGKIMFTAEELKGVPDDVVSGYTKHAKGSVDVYYVTYKTPDIFPIFKFAESPETRRKAHEGYESRLEVNTPLLDKALYLRRRIAAILGYKTWADYVTEVKMVKSAKNAEDFLDDLERKLQPVATKERTVLLAMKEAEHKQLGLPFDGEFYAWDYRYYDRKYVQQKLDLDSSLVAEYFPVAEVVQAILKIYQDLLGVRFEEITSDSRWHPDAQHFAVWKEDASDNSGFIGYCYLDLYPRAAKFPHAGVWSLKSGHHIPGGGYSYPVTAMVANVAKSTPGKPALMRHESVVTFFHEMGHAFHGLLSRTRFSRFHGTNVAWDFVEAPSKMLENWCWEPKVLKKMSSHYKTKEPLPPELVSKIAKSRFVNVGLFYLRQLFFSKFDLRVHTDLGENTDYTSLWNSLIESVSLLKTGKPCPGHGNFGHIMGGYDAGYYGYTYSLVFAMDMYATVFKADPLDPNCGKRYCDTILCPGGSRDALDLLTDFLGRPPNNEAFLEALFGAAPV
ncbi:hypothetical protein BD779DRAFT_1668682 [Infundibulicybe gibba]|nr:hypothetical protein BD779DRAFT_1668682 [Infundibulicybe gibba]